MRRQGNADVKIEVSEQFHRRPLEQIKLKLIESGLFGKVYSSFNDFAGHGYHGVSVMRSYLGFDARPVQVTGAVRDYPTRPHWSRVWQETRPAQKRRSTGIIEFEDGRLGVFHWTNVGYDSPLRWWRSSRFLAEKGMGITVGVGLDVEEWLEPAGARRRSARFHHAGTTMGAGRWRRASGHGRPHRRPRPAHRSLGQSLPPGRARPWRAVAR